MKRNFRKRYVVAAAAAIAVLLIALTDMKYFFLPHRDLLTAILSAEPLTAVPAAAATAELPLLTGSGEELKGTCLASKDGATLNFYAYRSSFRGDAETEQVVSAEGYVQLMSPIIVRDGKICFLAPVEMKDLTRVLKVFSGRIDPYAQHGLSLPTFTFGDKSSQGNFESIYLYTMDSYTEICYNISLFSNSDEGRRLFMDDGIYKTTVTFDDLYYYEYAINPLQQFILGGATR